MCPSKICQSKKRPGAIQCPNQYVLMFFGRNWIELTCDILSNDPLQSTLAIGGWPNKKICCYLYLAIDTIQSGDPGPILEYFTLR